MPNSLSELLPLAAPLTICDIGASLAEKPPYQALVERGVGQLVGFEPVPAECQRLNEKYGAPHRFYPCFIGDGAPHTFHETNYYQTGSLFEPNNTLNDYFQNLSVVTQLVARHPVTTVRLDDVEGLDDIDFLKIDVQGAELMVFRNAPRLLARTLLIQSEVEFLHHYKNQPLFADVDIELRQQGFVFHTFDGFGTRAFKPLAKTSSLNEGFRQVIWSDAIYVRDWMRLGELSAEKLRRYAILMHDLVESPDLCHLVLEELGRREGVNWGDRYKEWLGIGQAK